MAKSDIKVIFPDGNVKHIPNNSCSCPNILGVNVSNLIVGKKYTVFINNLNNTPVRTFPESYSFVADNVNKHLSFYYQFSQ
jgi:hypothetical protein